MVEEQGFLSLTFARMPRAPFLRSSANAEGGELRGGTATGGFPDF